jgi:hypothetical protein
MVGLDQGGKKEMAEAVRLGQHEEEEVPGHVRPQHVQGFATAGQGAVQVFQQKGGVRGPAHGVGLDRVPDVGQDAAQGWGMHRASRVWAGNPATSMARMARTGARLGMFTTLAKNPRSASRSKIVAPCTWVKSVK